jgi:hypothetical protein
MIATGPKICKRKSSAAAKMNFRYSLRLGLEMKLKNKTRTNGEK